SGSTRTRVVWIDVRAQWSLPDVLQTAKTSRRLYETRREIEGAASAQKHATRRKATDSAVEAEARVRSAVLFPDQNQNPLCRGSLRRGIAEECRTVSNRLSAM